MLCWEVETGKVLVSNFSAETWFGDGHRFGLTISWAMWGAWSRDSALECLGPRATRYDVNPGVAAMIVPAKSVERIFMERHVSVCVSLRNARDSFQKISAKARESILHGRRKRTNPHRERFAKEMAKEKSESNLFYRGFGNSSNGM